MPQPGIGRVSNFGIETTEGTAITANKQLQGSSLIPDIETEVGMGGPAFAEHDTYAQQLREWTKIEVPDTAISFTDITYLLELLVAGGVTPTLDGTNGQQRVYAPSDTIKTYTVEFGDSNEADRVAGVFLDTLNLTMAQNAARMTGSGMGRLMTVGGITLAASPTLISQVVIDPTNWSVRIADTLAGLTGASDQPDVYEASFSISGRWGVHYPMDPANPSFKGRVKRKPTLEASISITNDAAGRALITTNLRTNTKKFVRLNVDGPVIAGATPSQYRLRIEFLGFVKSAPQRRDFEDLVVLPVTFGLAKDSTLTAYQITSITELITL